MDFLKKIIQNGKLELVQPSEEIKLSYIQKSESHLLSAKILLQNNLLEESVSMAYYSMYHMLIALLFRTGIKCENHTASIQLLKEIFNLNNEEILFAKKERIDKQYYIDFNITKEETSQMIEKADIFNKELLDFIDKLNTQKIKEYRERFEKELK